MPRRTEPVGRRGLVAACVAAAVACGCTTTVAPTVDAGPGPVSAVQEPAAASTLSPVPVPETTERAAALRGYRAARDVEAVALPTRVRVPAIGVDSALERLGRNPDGTVAVPSSWGRAGWFEGAARPGQQGPAVVLGHVDSRAGPAVFFRLGELAAGDEVLVDREDGTTARFVVDRVERHPKDAFPTDDVYFPTLEPTLRLVTCGGEFDPAVGHYRDNVIAFATLAADAGPTSPATAAAD